MFKKVVIAHGSVFLVGLFFAISCIRTAHADDQPLQQSLIPHLTTHFKTPEDYILHKFKSHDLVIVGEMHHVKQNLDLLHRLIPKLYSDCGVRFLGYEVFASSLQSEIDMLVTAKTYDETLAMEIIRESASRFGQPWPYEEYVDIFKVVWRLNQNVGQTSDYFYIVFMAPDINWRAFHYGNREERKAAFQQLAAGDRHYADQIIREYDRSGRKGLVWCGSQHAVTQLKRNPRRGPELRMGGHLWERYGNKVFMIRLHEAALFRKKGFSLGYLLGGELENALRGFGKPVGFDIAESPLADVKLPKDTLWAIDNPGATLSAYCDGYIWLVPLEKFRGNRPLDIEHVIPDEQTFRRIARNAHSKSVQEMKTRGEYIAAFKEAEKKFKHFPESFMPFLSGMNTKVEPSAGKDKASSVNGENR